MVLTSGVGANIEFLNDTDIETSKFGLVYDATGKTNDDCIYGAGDVNTVDNEYHVHINTKNNSYKKIICKKGKIEGAII